MSFLGKSKACLEILLRFLLQFSEFYELALLLFLFNLTDAVSDGLGEVIVDQKKALQVVVFLG